MGIMEITLASSSVLDRIKVAEYHAIYISTSVNSLKQNSPCLIINRLTHRLG